MISSECFERMDGLCQIKAQKALRESIRTIFTDLLAEGFEPLEIQDYVERVAYFTIDDMLFDIEEEEQDRIERDVQDTLDESVK